MSAPRVVWQPLLTVPPLPCSPSFPPAYARASTALHGGGPETNETKQGQTAEAAALNVSQQLNLQSLPIRQYLETTVVSLLVNGLTQLVKARPEDPVEYLAAYLLKNNPKKKGGAPNAPNP